ncbi:hypothetical protein SKAU_G00204540 [Synaphobranchus kaupii]|uniref:Uncharacterized protein n=1 Tax=Synaphobranchus kaupii TaxID=118154 RepID=A0A9Q1FG42_SYNKA|nr:hypothetical protein SKAU_G00204540 [Synaphobranchus kaupii]
MGFAFGTVSIRVPPVAEPGRTTGGVPQGSALIPCKATPQAAAAVAFSARAYSGVFISQPRSRFFFNDTSRPASQEQQVAGPRCKSNGTAALESHVECGSGPWLSPGPIQRSGGQDI